MLDPKQFRKYVGMSVPVSVASYTREVNGTMRGYRSYMLEPSTVLDKIKQEAHPNTVRIWLPDTRGTTDARDDRLNVYVRSPDGDVTFIIYDIKVG